MVIFDANMILRYLLNDNKPMAEKAEQYLNTSEVAVTVEVIAEVVYVLKGVYSLDRKEISDTIKGFLEMVYCSKKNILNYAFDVYSVHNLDFVDCVLAGYHFVESETIATFDERLLKLLNT